MIDQILKEREKWFKWKNIKPLKEIVEKLKSEIKNKDIEYAINDIIEIKTIEHPLIEETARALKPWRKGPFKINNLFIESEWNSFIKWNLIKDKLDLENKDILDIGCNNGYYMFRMLEKKPNSIIGFDPSPLFNLQFEFINSFIKSNIEYKLLGIEHLPIYEKKFDVIFAMGVLYHRQDPLKMLKDIKNSLNKNSFALLDTLIIEGDEEIALIPKRYAKMKNVYFIPTLKGLYNLIEKANFKNIEFIGKKYTTLEEQRKTEWIDGESLEHFLNKELSKTIEGYPPPLRVYLKIYN